MAMCSFGVMIRCLCPPLHAPARSCGVDIRDICSRLEASHEVRAALKVDLSSLMMVQNSAEPVRASTASCFDYVLEVTNRIKTVHPYGKGGRLSREHMSAPHFGGGASSVRRPAVDAHFDNNFT